MAPGRALPNAGFAIAPHSPLASGLTRLQSGTKLRFASAHERVVLVTSVLSGLGSAASGEPAASFCRYLFRLTFTAVFPFPVGSTLRPRRGLRSCHAVFVCAGNVMSRAGARTAGPACCSGKLLAK